MSAPVLTSVDSLSHGDIQPTGVAALQGMMELGVGGCLVIVGLREHPPGLAVVLVGLVLVTLCAGVGVARLAEVMARDAPASTAAAAPGTRRAILGAVAGALVFFAYAHVADLVGVPSVIGVLGAMSVTIGGLRLLTWAVERRQPRDPFGR